MEETIKTKHTSDDLFKAIRANSSETILKIGHSDRSLLKLKKYLGETALTYSCRVGSTEIVKLLRSEFNVDIHETGFYGRNCYLSAARGGKIDTMRYLH
jgi:hypothetical protein